MRLPPLTEKAGRIAHESLRPVSNNNVYLTRTELSSPAAGVTTGRRKPRGRRRADEARVNTYPLVGRWL